MINLHGVEDTRPRVAIDGVEVSGYPIVFEHAAKGR